MAWHGAEWRRRRSRCGYHSVIASEDLEQSGGEDHVRQWARWAVIMRMVEVDAEGEMQDAYKPAPRL